MEYQIVETTSKAELEKEVKKLIANGWKPLGGVSIALGALTLYYAQAMIKQ